MSVLPQVTELPLHERTTYYRPGTENEEIYSVYGAKVRAVQRVTQKSAELCGMTSCEVVTPTTKKIQEYDLDCGKKCYFNNCDHTATLAFYN